jgi:hypothetical protein
MLGLASDGPISQPGLIVLDLKLPNSRPVSAGNGLGVA